MTRTRRIAHLGDTHLGYRALPVQHPESGRNQRSVDVEEALRRTVDDILGQQVDLVIHAGDVFHQSRPSWHAVRQFVWEMRRLENAGIPVVVIAGNHDTPRYRAGGSVFSLLEVALPTTRISAGYEEEEIDLPDLGLRIQAVPHGALTNPNPPVTWAVAGRANILATHGMARGVLSPGMVSEPGEQELDGDLFQQGFAYVALGHYHLHMMPFAPAWYAGSTERMGWGDADATPGYVIVSIDGEALASPPEHRAIHTRPFHTLKPVHGDASTSREMADAVLGQLEHLGDPQAITRVQLRDADRAVFREVERTLRREAQALTLHLSVTRPREEAAPMAVDPDRLAQARDLETLFTEFVGQRTGETYSQEFASRFLERGTAALREARQRVTESEGSAP